MQKNPDGSALNSGYKGLMIITVDTDIVVYSLANYHSLEDTEYLWIELETGKELCSYSWEPLEEQRPW